MLSFPFHTQPTEWISCPFCRIFTGKDKTCLLHSPHCLKLDLSRTLWLSSPCTCGGELWVGNLSLQSKGSESRWRCHMIDYVRLFSRCHGALSALSSLQGNRCQQSCEAGFYHGGQDGACQACHHACATCAGESVRSRVKVQKCTPLNAWHEASCLQYSFIRK